MMYSPKSVTEIKLFSSIPKKVMSWIELIPGAKTNSGKIGNLSWKQTAKGGSISIVLENDETIVVKWDGSPFNPGNLRGSVIIFENIFSDLKEFVRIEQAIYNELEKYSEMVA